MSSKMAEVNGAHLILAWQAWKKLVAKFVSNKSLRQSNYKLNQLELNGSREPLVAEKL